MVFPWPLDPRSYGFIPPRLVINTTVFIPSSSRFLFLPTLPIFLPNNLLFVNENVVYFDSQAALQTQHNALFYRL